MLMYGNIVPTVINFDTKIYNLASFLEGPFIKLNYLIPPNNIGHSDSYEFDVEYAKYLMTNDYAFIELFGLILELEYGNDLLILISDLQWSENIVESLFKFIQQRYGYNGVRINNDEDYLYFRDQVFDFNPNYGIYNLDADRNRYSILVEKIRISSGGEICSIV